MEREDIENSLKVLSHIVDDDFIITVDEARKIIRIDGETIEALEATIELMKLNMPDFFPDANKGRYQRWRCRMVKYIELIDKYRIEQGEGGYNPPSYVWADNTGEIVRCKDCKHGRQGYGVPNGRVLCAKPFMGDTVAGAMHDDDWYCADGEREVQE